MNPFLVYVIRIVILDVKTFDIVCLEFEHVCLYYILKVFINMKNDTVVILEDSHFYVGSCKYLFKNDIILSVTFV